MNIRRKAPKHQPRQDRKPRSRSKRIGRAFGALALVLALLNTACISWVEIDPEDLPRLSENSSAQLQEAVETGDEGGFSPESVVTGTEIESVEGELVTIRPPYDTRLASEEGSLIVEGPVAAAIVNGSLILQGPSTERLTVPIADLESVKVSQFSTVRTYLLVLGIAVGVAVGGVMVIALD